MHRALRPGGDVLALQELYNCGAQIDSVDEHGRTVLYVAAAAGFESAVEWILGHGADVVLTAVDGRSALHAAAASGHVRTIELLLGALDNVTAMRALQAEDAQGRTPSDVAAAAQHMDVVRALLTAHSRMTLGVGRAR